jgi:hypothetical protein
MEGVILDPLFVYFSDTVFVWNIGGTLSALT